MIHIIEMTCYDKAERPLMQSTSADHLMVRIDVPEDTAYIEVGPALPLPCRVSTEWAVAYGGEDANDCAGILQYDDEADARERVQWIKGGFVARRTVTASAWEAVREDLCCDLHGRTCEPPSELCCEHCTEHDHPRHSDGSACSNPDLSAAAALLDHRPPGVRHNHPPGTDHPDGIWGCHACALKALESEGGTRQ